MTRIDFYILPQASERDRALFACRLAEKAYLQDYRIFVHTDSAAATDQLDELLWTFRQGSFLPHARAADAAEPVPPILLGHDSEPGGDADLLINLDHSVPGFFSRFERLAEVIDQRTESVAAGRERYRFYQERGYQLQTHKLQE